MRSYILMLGTDWSEMRRGGSHLTWSHHSLRLASRTPSILAAVQPKGKPAPVSVLAFRPGECLRPQADESTRCQNF